MWVSTHNCQSAKCRQTRWAVRCLYLSSCPLFLFHFGDTTRLMKRDTLCPDNNNYCYRSDICTYVLAFYGSEDSQCPEAENFVTAVNEVVENVELLDYRMDEVEERIETLYYLRERALSIVDQVNDTFVRQRRRIDLLEPIIDSIVNISDTISSLEDRIEGHGNWCREQLEQRDLGLRECKHNSTEGDRQLRGHREQLAEMSNCPADWHYFNGRCYYVQSNELYSWQEAYDICYDMDGRLVIIQDRQLDDFLRTLHHGNLWIGLSDVRSEGHWEWIDGTPLNYSNWYQNEPNNEHGGEDCGQMRKTMDGLWNDEPCATTCGFICENNKASPNLWFNFRSVGSIPGEDRIEPTDDVMITNQGCDSGWRYFKGRYYCVRSNEVFTWQEAHDICHSLDGRLAIAHDELVNNFLASFTDVDLWIGLNDIRYEGLWEWIDGTQVNYTNWYPREPNDHKGKEDCAHMIRNMDGKWNDANCLSFCGFVCEKNILEANCIQRFDLSAADTITLTTPNFPNYYDNMLNCLWTVSVPEDVMIRVEFKSFKTEARCDFMSAGHGREPESGTSVISRHSGDGLPESFIGSPTVWISFISDSSIVDPGFEVVISAYHDMYTSFNTRTTLKYTASDCLSLHWLSAGNDVVIKSPNYPNMYHNDVECTWVISTNFRYHFRVSFNTFNTEARYDTLVTGTGIQPGIGNLHLSSGSDLPNDFTVSSSDMWLRFQSDSSVRRTGFRLVITAVQ